MIPGPVAVSLNGRSDTRSTAGAAEAPLASDSDAPSSPNAGTTSFRCFRVEPCFVFGIREILPSPVRCSLAPQKNREGYRDHDNQQMNEPFRGPFLQRQTKTKNVDEARARRD